MEANPILTDTLRNLGQVKERPALELMQLQARLTLLLKKDPGSEDIAFVAAKELSRIFHSDNSFCFKRSKNGFYKCDLSPSIEELRFQSVKEDEHLQVERIFSQESPEKSFSEAPQQKEKGSLSFKLSLAAEDFLLILLEVPKGEILEILAALTQGFFDQLANLSLELENLRSKNRELEKIKLRQENIAALGSLTREVAFEIKSPLSVISAAGEVLKQKAQGKEEFEKYLDMQTRNIDRIDALVKGIDRHYNEKPPKIALCQLNVIIEETAHFVKTLFNRSQLQVINNCKSSLMVRCDPIRLQQVFINLLINAKHAMDEGQAEKKVFITCEEEKGKGKIEIRIKDLGTGISWDISDRIFEKYFTTKEKEGAAGLGLKISKYLVEQMQGTLALKNAGFRGAEFVITLPGN